MPYNDGSWGEKAQQRSKRRLKYFREYDKNRYVPFMGFSVSKEIDLKAFISQRGLKCQLCGKFPKLKRYFGLLIHHQDQNIKNNDLTNLLIVCRGCHNRIHKKKFNPLKILKEALNV